MSDQPFHILSINETRLSQSIYDDIMAINGNEIYRKDRNREGGGVALYIKTALNTKIRHDLVPEGLECICVEIKGQNCKPFLIATWYSYMATKQFI